MSTRILPQHAHDEASTISRMMWAAPIIAGAALFFLVTAWAQREVGQTVSDQVNREESAFCQRLIPSPGAPYAACLQDLSQLIKREQEIRSDEF